MTPAAVLARAVFDAIEAHDTNALRQLIHPDAELEMAMARGELVQGRDAVLQTLTAAWGRVHTLTIHELHPLSEEAVIIQGRSRHPLEGGGFADSGVVWLCEYDDDMLRRQRLFPSVGDAQAVWERESRALKRPT